MVLHGWKQIAQYLGCGIRTAQRWESQCGLPVTRPRNHLRSPVLAHSEALDSWAGGASTGAANVWEERIIRIEREMEELKRQLASVAGATPAESRRAPAAAERAPAATSAPQRPMPLEAHTFDA